LDDNHAPGLCKAERWKQEQDQRGKHTSP
jgi:hypothetical protein